VLARHFTHCCFSKLSSSLVDKIILFFPKKVKNCSPVMRLIDVHMEGGYLVSTNFDIEKLFLEYSDDIYNYLIYYTGHYDVEDLLQEVFIKAIRFYDTYQGDASVKSWLFSIARNVANDFYRRQKRIQWVPMKLLEIFHIEYDTPESILESKDNSNWLMEKIHELKPSYREVILMRFINELSISETALALNWSESRVSSTYHRAFKKLKVLMEKETGREVV
jgi:RNA polymerase sigma-70 factor, ECF subfamily